MLSRSATLRQAIARQAKLQSTRTYASGSFAYQTSDANGIKVASRDQAGPVTTLALVAKAGTRYEFVPGLAEGLDRYAFKSTERRSALRIQRESELLGAELYRYHTRENLVVGAKFLRDDLPYFLELLAEVATQTKYQQHVLNEEVYPLMELNMKKHLGNPLSLATDSAHGLAFHRGLGAPLSPTSSTPFKKYLSQEALTAYAGSAYSKPNFAIVANGVEDGALNKWVGEFFTDVSAQSEVEIKSQQSKYYGGEERIAHAGGNAVVLGFTGSSSATGSFYKPELSVLASLLGGESSIKWSPGFSLLAKAAQDTPLMHISTKSNIYTDAGLLTISLKGTAQDIRSSAPKVVEALKSAAQGISAEDFQKAKALAKFKELEYGASTQGGIELTGAGLVRDGKAYQIEEVASAIDGVTVEKVKQAAKEALENKASVSTVGDLYALPYAEEMGLKV